MILLSALCSASDNNLRRSLYSKNNDQIKLKIPVYWNISNKKLVETLLRWPTFIGLPYSYQFYENMMPLTLVRYLRLFDPVEYYMSFVSDIEIVLKTNNFYHT